MRVETTRTAGTVRLRHAVGFTDGFGPAVDAVAAATPFVAAARGRDEPVAPAVRPATARALAAVPPAEGLPGPSEDDPEVVPLAVPEGPDHSLSLIHI